jgi:hypothetical protein
MWFWMNKNSTVECSSQMLQIFRNIKEKRKWNKFFKGWLRLKKCHGEDKFFDIVRANGSLCSNKYDENKWICFGGEQTFKNITTIFAEETKMIFHVNRSHPAVKNCSKPGRCGIILKTTPAKYGANMIVCTDLTDYSSKIHYHDEFQAKDMNFSTFVSASSIFFVPLSWNGIPVTQNGEVYWGELLSDCTKYEKWCLKLFVQLPNQSD